LTKVYPFLFLFLVFGSLISGPLFINNTPQTGIPIILQALAEESSDDESSDSGDEKEEEEAEEEKEEEETEEEKEEEEAEEEKCDETDEETEEEEADQEKCDETDEEIEEETEEEKEEETEEEKEEETEEEKEEKEKESLEETEEEKEEETKKEFANAVADSEEHTLLEEILSDDSLIEEVINDKTTEADLASTLLVIKQEHEETDKEIDIVADSEEYTLLDEILNDESLLKDVISDNTTEAVLVSTLLDINQEPVQNPSTTEICGNQADDDGDGTIDEDCNPTTLPPTELTETCANQTDDDGDGIVDEEDCVVPPAETCANQTDDDGDGIVDEEDCTVLPTEICDNDLDDDADGKTDDADEDDCPAIMPAVEIESAEDEEGEPLAQEDIIAPGEVTFTFSAKIDEIVEDTEQSYEFECALDGESFNTCSSPQTVSMEDGKHTFVVRLAQ